MGVEAALLLFKTKASSWSFACKANVEALLWPLPSLLAWDIPANRPIDLLTTARTVADPRRWYIRRQIKASKNIGGQDKYNGEKNK